MFRLGRPGKKRSVFILLIPVLVPFIIGVSASVSVEQWEKTFGKTNGDGARASRALEEQLD